ncbi:unnamed protein product [Mytilus edulis]|uniref:AIG1-type G domain-containing protein n=1 Tax=Mytilus edulis TaxID=6550 RepID=A0A8S3SGX3_MYTED|nr:unnamed protein product [Mytilus edulis]
MLSTTQILTQLCCFKYCKSKDFDFRGRTADCAGWQNWGWKSACANTLARGQIFEAKMCLKGVTQCCQYTMVKFGSRKIVVIDTPGILDAEMDPIKVEHEIKLCTKLAAPGLHAILVVLSLHRFDKGDLEVLKFVVKLFGDNCLSFIIVLFTHGDSLLTKKLHWRKNLRMHQNH